MEEGRASKSYKYFVETFIFWQKLFDNGGDMMSILKMPYPLYNDVILKQLDEKKTEKRKIEEQMKKGSKQRKK